MIGTRGSENRSTNYHSGWLQTSNQNRNLSVLAHGVTTLDLHSRNSSTLYLRKAGTPLNTFYQPPNQAISRCTGINPAELSKVSSFMLLTVRIEDGSYFQLRNRPSNRIPGQTTAQAKILKKNSNHRKENRQLMKYVYKDARLQHSMDRGWRTKEKTQTYERCSKYNFTKLLIDAL